MPKARGGSLPSAGITFSLSVSRSISFSLSLSIYVYALLPLVILSFRREGGGGGGARAHRQKAASLKRDKETERVGLLRTIRSWPTTVSPHLDVVGTHKLCLFAGGAAQLLGGKHQNHPAAFVRAGRCPNRICGSITVVKIPACCHGDVILL